MRNDRTPRHVLSILAATCVTLLGCSDATDPAHRGGASIISISADVSATTAGLTVEVSARDIDPPIVQNIPIVGTVASGTLTIPAGSERTLTVRAFDEGTIETHRATEMLDIHPDETVDVTVTLEPLFGDVPITVTIADVAIAITPSPATAVLFGTVQLTATVTDAAGTAIPGVSVGWGAMNPVIASVDADGLVTGGVAGTTTIVAHVGRVVAAADVTVEGTERISFNRQVDGNDEIYLMNVDGSAVVNLTNHPNTELFSTWSPDGRRLAFSSNRPPAPGIWVADADGSNPAMILSTAPGTPDGLTWSPDGQRFTYAALGDVWTVNADGSGATNLTNETGSARSRDPSWSPDGQRMVFASDRDGDQDLYLMNADGTQVVQLTDTPEYDVEPAWSPDGQVIAFVSEGVSGSGAGLYTMNVDGSGGVRLVPGFFVSSPVWAPDGARIAFMNLLGPGITDIYVMNADGTNVTNVTNDPTTLDRFPTWAVVVGTPN